MWKEEKEKRERNSNLKQLIPSRIRDCLVKHDFNIDMERGEEEENISDFSLFIKYT